MTIEVLSAKQVPSRAIARQLGVAESTVRYHLRRSREGVVDGPPQGRLRGDIGRLKALHENAKELICRVSRFADLTSHLIRDEE